MFETQHKDVTPKGQALVLNQKSENLSLSSTFSLLTLSTKKHFPEGQVFPQVWTHQCRSDYFYALSLEIRPWRSQKEELGLPYTYPAKLSSSEELQQAQICLQHYSF